MDLNRINGVVLNKTIDVIISLHEVSTLRHINTLYS